MDAFTLKLKKDTNELHLFKGKMTDRGCTTRQRCICDMMDKSESEGDMFTCNTEKQARELCAIIGKDVCGVCVSLLYSTYV